MKAIFFFRRIESYGWFVMGLHNFVTKFHYSLNTCSKFSFDQFKLVGFFVGSKFYQPNQLSIIAIDVEPTLAEWEVP